MAAARPPARRPLAAAWLPLALLAAALLPPGPPARAFLAQGTQLLPGRRAARRSGPRPSGRGAVARRADSGEDAGGGGADADWRDFRARLVKQEQGGGADGGGAEEQGWAYTTPLIEQGSLLLAATSDHFALNQQYFHKASENTTVCAKESTRA